MLLSGYYFWTLRPDVLLVAPGAMPVLGDVLRYTVSPLLGRLFMPLLKRAMFSPLPVPARFRRGLFRRHGAAAVADPGASSMTAR